MAKLRIAFLVVALGLALAACGSSGSSNGASNSTTTTAPSSASSAPAAAGATVALKNLKFSPDKVSVKVGEKVTWEWKENVLHNVTAKDGSFKSPNQTDGTFSHTFTKAGSFDYECTLHSGMTGTVTVQ